MEWRGEERKGKSSSEAKAAKSAKYLQSVPYWAASVRRGQYQRDHQDQSSVYRVGRRLDGKECKAHQGGKERKSPPARQRRPSWPKNLQSVPYRAASARRVKKGQQDHQEPSSVYRVRRWLDGEECKAHQGGEERKSPPARRRLPSQPKLAECTVSGGLCEESKERKVNATIKIHQVCTVSGGGWMERSAKPIKAAKKGKALQQGKDGQVGQNLQSVPYRAASARRVKIGHRDHQDPSSVYRVRRRLDGEV
jgi:hypothetical protein